MIKYVYWSSRKVPDILHILYGKFRFLEKICTKNSNIKFNENPSTKSRVVSRRWTDGETGMTKLIADFRNFANVPKIDAIKVIKL